MVSREVFEFTKGMGLFNVLNWLKTAVSKETTHYALGYLHYKDGVLWATNGHVLKGDRLMVEHPFEEETFWEVVKSTKTRIQIARMNGDLRYPDTSTIENACRTAITGGRVTDLGAYCCDDDDHSAVTRILWLAGRDHHRHNGDVNVNNGHRLMSFDPFLVQDAIKGGGHLRGYLQLNHDPEINQGKIEIVHETMFFYNWDDQASLPKWQRFCVLMPRRI